MERTGIFVSYSRKDSEWKDKLQSHLTPIIRDESVDYFIDDEIEPGVNWEEQLQGKLSAAKVIIVLVSSDFFASDYIFTKELPEVIELAETEQAMLVRIDVRPCRVPSDCNLDIFQKAHSGDALSALDENGVDTVFKEVADLVDRAIREIEIGTERGGVDSEQVATSPQNSKSATKKKKITKKRKVNSKKKKKQVGTKKGRKTVANKTVNPHGKSTCANAPQLTDEGIAVGMVRSAPHMNALKLWIANTLSEWVFHDPWIYTYEVRVKSADSIIRKKNRLLKENARTFLDFEELVRSFHDIVGARLLAHTTSTVEYLHLYICNHPRFQIRKVIVHFPEKSPPASITSIIERTRAMHGLTIDSRPNRTGYTGVHYRINPKPIDEIYPNELNECMHDTFELQVRTVIQHAWSELQHKVIYKEGEYTEKDVLEGKFEVLSDVINNADGLLDRINGSNRLTDSRDYTAVQPEVHALKPIFNFNREFNQSTATKQERFIAGESLADSVASDIENFLNTGTYDQKLEIAMFYLNGTKYPDAERIYSSLLASEFEKETLFNWALLRYIETCSALAKESQVRDSVKRLGQRLIEAESVVSEDYRLYLTGSVIAWRCRNLELAVNLGQVVVEKFLDLNPLERAKALINQIYFEMEFHQKMQVEEAEYNKDHFLEELEGLVNFEHEAFELFTANDISALPNQYDSLAWYHFFLAKEYWERGRAKEARTEIATAESYMENCFKLSKDKNSSDVDQFANFQIWKMHRSEIKKLARKLVADSPS